eukprot:g39965.t1
MVETDTLISIKDRHLSTSLYCKPTDNLMLLHFSSFQPEHVKEVILYRPTRHTHTICLDEEECDGPLRMLKDTLIRTRYDAQLNRQFQHATVKNHNNLLKRQTWDMTYRVPFIVHYFPGVEKLSHILCSLQHVIDDVEHLTKAIPTPRLLTFKQLPNLKQTIACIKLPSLQENSNHNTIQPCHGNLSKTCQIDLDTTITYGNTTHEVHGNIISEASGEAMLFYSAWNLYYCPVCY